MNGKNAKESNMIRLNKILNEIKINKPFVLNKQAVLDWWLNEGNIYLFSYMTKSPSANELVSDEGYNDLEEYLTDQFGMDPDKITLYESYIAIYYRMFKPKEILVDIFGDDYGTFTKGTPYKNIIIEYIGNREYMLYCNNY
jgi:hypothetical protein